MSNGHGKKCKEGISLFSLSPFSIKNKITLTINKNIFVIHTFTVIMV